MADLKTPEQIEAAENLKKAKEAIIALQRSGKIDHVLNFLKSLRGEH